MKEIVTKVFEFGELNDKAKEKARDWYRRCQDGDTYWSEGVIEDAVEQAKLMGITIDTSVRHTHRPTPRPIHDPCVWFSGFWSQGDGACFEGSWSASNVQADKLKEDCTQDKELHRIVDVFASIAKDYPNARFTVKHRGHYSHKYCTEFDVQLLSDDESDAKCEQVAYMISEEIGIDADASKVAEVDKRIRDREWAQYRKDEEALIENARDFMEWIYRTLEKEYEYQNSDEVVDESIEANEYTFTEDGERFG